MQNHSTINVLSARVQRIYGLPKVEAGSCTCLSIPEGTIEDETSPRAEGKHNKRKIA